jgi:hypothetical protein
MRGAIPPFSQYASMVRCLFKHRDSFTFTFYFCIGLSSKLIGIVPWQLNLEPVSMAGRSKASTVFGRSNIGIAGSNPARGMDVCVFLCCVVLCR